MGLFAGLALDQKSINENKLEEVGHKNIKSLSQQSNEECNGNDYECILVEYIHGYT